MTYNTQQKKLVLPEYGRAIQSMVDYAVTIEDRTERQQCAETIVAIMKGMFPEQQEIPDYEQKLWDHLAIMANFQLDIDYPVEIIRPENVHRTPDTIPYVTGDIRYRHYGRYIPDIIHETTTMPDGEERKELIKLIAIQMKKEQLLWNQEGQDDQRVLADIASFSDGQIQIDKEDVQLSAVKIPTGSTLQVQQGGKKKKKKKKNY